MASTMDWQVRRRNTPEEIIASAMGDDPPTPAFRYRPGDYIQPTITATRADATTCARYRDRQGIWQVVAANVLRDSHYVYDPRDITGNVRTMLREGASTNSALGSCSFGDGTYWAGNTDFTIATATSCIAGQTAYKHTNNNAAVNRARNQQTGTFVNGQTDCISWIVENIDAVTTNLAIYDATAGAFVHRATFTWATLSIATDTGSGTSGVIDLGNGRYRLWLTATGTGAGTGAAGNNRYNYCYATGTTQNGKAAIIHHAQFEAASSYPSSPIVTVAGSVTRAADLISLPWTRNPEAGTWYVDAYDLMGGSGATYRYLYIVGTAGGAACTQIYKTGGPSSELWRSRVTMAAGNSDSNAGVNTTIGQRAELRHVLAVSGGNVTGTLGQSINAGAEVVGAAGTARALDASWVANAKLYIGDVSSGIYPANLAIRSLCYSAGAEYTMDEMRRGVGATWSYTPGDTLAGPWSISRADTTVCARYRDSSGIWQLAPANALRDGHYHYDGTQNVRTLLREGAGTNLCTYSSTIQSWGAANTGTTVDGSATCGITLALLTDTDGAATYYRQSANLTFGTGGVERAFSFFVKQGTSNSSYAALRDDTVGTYRCYISISWTSGVPNISAINGTLLSIEPEADGIYRLCCQTNTAVVAGNNHSVRLAPAVTAASTGSIYFGGIQVEDASYPSSPIVTVAGAVTRAADVISVPWTRNPEAGTWYMDAYDLMSGNATVVGLGIGPSPMGVKSTELYKASGVWKATYTNAAAATSTSIAAASPSYGNRVELRQIIAVSGGNVTEQIGQSINSAAEAVAAAGTARAIDAAFGGPPTYLTIGYELASTFHANLAIRSLCYVPGAEQTMNQMRRAAGP